MMMDMSQIRAYYCLIGAKTMEKCQNRDIKALEYAQVFVE